MKIYISHIRIPVVHLCYPLLLLLLFLVLQIEGFPNFHYQCVSISHAVAHNLAISLQASTQQLDELTFVFLIQEEGLLITVSLYIFTKLNISTRFTNSSLVLVIFNCWTLYVAIKHNTTVAIPCTHIVYISLYE